MIFDVDEKEIVEDDVDVVSTKQTSDEELQRKKDENVLL